MQSCSSWSVSAAKALFTFFFAIDCVSAITSAGIGTAVSLNLTLPSSTSTNNHTSNISATTVSASSKLPLSTASSIQSNRGWNTSSSSTSPLLSTAGTIRTSSSFSSNSSSSSSSISSNSLSSVPLRSQLPTDTGSTASSTGSLQGTASSSNSSSLPSVTIGAPSITTATIVQSGKTETVPVIGGGSYSSPITLPPITTTLASAQATSSVSSVSSELAGLIPIISSWKAKPTLLKSDTLNKIKPVKSDVEDLISNLGGGSSSSGCGSKGKRGLLGTIGNIINRLSCIDEDLGSITDNINADDVVAIDNFLVDLTSENNDLTNDDNKSNSKSNSDTSTNTEKSSSSSSSSCTSSNTALQVTVQCVPTSFSTSGSTTLTTTCSPLTTVTASGCSVTGLTTTISASTSASKTQTACASGTCGDACPMNGGPLSGAKMGIVASTEDCASISTRITSALPTASYGVAETTAIASPTSESIVVAPSKRSFLSDLVSRDKTLVDRSIVERALPDVTPNYANYVRNLNSVWISQVGAVSGQFFDYLAFGHSAAGVNGLYGCTSVLISSEKGVYISHIWEDPVFITGDSVPTDDNTFTTKGFNALRDGTATAQSISALVGTDQAPGPLNAIYSPEVFVITPRTDELDRNQYGITTALRYETRAQQLAQKIAQIVPGSGGTGYTLGYTRTSAQLSTEYPGTAGRAILEVDPFQYWVTTPNAPADSPGVHVGRWRLWVEGQLITYNDFWHPDTTPPGGIQRRDVGYENPCAKSSNHSVFTSSSASSTSSSSSASSTSSSSSASSTSSSSSASSTSSSTFITSTTPPPTTSPPTTNSPTSTAFSCTSNP